MPAPMMQGYGYRPQLRMPAVPATVKRPPMEPLAPPPGTLGRTYKQLSTPVPEEEHPRTGMLEICNVPAGYTATIRGMDGYLGKNGAWCFKTVRPLIPTVPYVYTIHFHGPNCHAGRCGPKTACDYRVVRLIPGRIVYLNY